MSNLPHSIYGHDIRGTSSMAYQYRSDVPVELDDTESCMGTVAMFLEQLHARMTTPAEKEMITEHLLSILGARKEARAMIGSHYQAIPLLISILRCGTLPARANAAAILSSLCREDELRVKVLLGGCVPPLLSLLNSEALEARRAAAEAISELSSGGLSDDHVGMKIFITEGVVPTLWGQLDPKIKQDKVVEGFVTGALRNLCRDKDEYWKVTFEAGGMEIITALLSSDNPSAQANAAFLLARLIMAFDDSAPKVIDVGVVENLLHLLHHDNEISVRASAADALEAFSTKSVVSKKAIVNAGGIPILVGAVVAPSKESMLGVGGSAHALQEHAIRAMANICGGMSSLIIYLCEISQDPHVSSPLGDIIGTLAYSLMVFDDKEDTFEVIHVESTLITVLRMRENKFVQDRVLEALASLYGNSSLTCMIHHSTVKRLLVGLITMAFPDVREQLILSFITLCCSDAGLWDAFGKREGVQLLISLLGLSGEQHQECAVALLAILTDEVDDCKWAITAAGGIPPLVQLLETGPQKSRENAAHVLWNLCSHSDDIRTCVESAGAIPSLLWLLKCGGSKGQEASSKALCKLIFHPDSATTNQLLALLLSNSDDSKSHAIKVLGHVLILSSNSDLVQTGTPANKGLKSLVGFLNSSNEEIQECAASVIADLFSTHQDICANLVTDEIVHPLMKLLTSKIQGVATQSARALGALSHTTTVRIATKMPYLAEGDVKPLIRMAKTSSIDAAETALAALANLLSDQQIAGEAIADGVVCSLVRLFEEGSLEGKKSASRALHQLLRHFPVSDVFVDKECRFIVMALADTLAAMGMEEIELSDSLDVLVLLVRAKQRFKFCHPLWTPLAEAPARLEPLVRCLVYGSPSVQDKTITILSRLCLNQPNELTYLLVGTPKCLVALANRTMACCILEVKIGGACLLISAAKENRKQFFDALETSGLLTEFIRVLVDILRCHSGSSIIGNESQTPRHLVERNFFLHEMFEVPDAANILGRTVVLWLLAIFSSSHKNYKHTIMETGGIDVLSYELALYAANPQVEFGKTEGLWISALLLASLFRDSLTSQSPDILQIIPSLACLIKSDRVIDQYFAAQALASLVSAEVGGLHLVIANSGSVVGLINLIGRSESEMLNLIALSKEFNLPKDPDQAVLERLFEIEDVRTGATARKSIPLLVDLLRPMPDRPGAPPASVKLLTLLADGNEVNKLAMADAGALDALNKYLSLSPQDPTEATITDLLGILYSNPDLLRCEASLNTLNQLIAVLRLGSRNARLSAARTLQAFFYADNIRETEIARQAIQPLVDMLDSGSEREQEASLVALIRLTSGSSSKAMSLTDVEGDPLKSLYKILSSCSTLELKSYAAELCFVMFGNLSFQTSPIASECILPLISLMSSDSELAIENSVRAFERLLEDERNAERAATYDVVYLLSGFVSDSNYHLSETSVSALIKLGRDRPHCKLDMVKAGIIDRVLELLNIAPVSLCLLIVQLLRVLTNNNNIAKSSIASTMVEPLFLVLQRMDFTFLGQQSSLQALINILEKPQSLATLNLTPSQVLEPLITSLESPSQAIQELSIELLSHILEQEQFQHDITLKNAVMPLLRLAGIRILNLQKMAIKALESISASWPRAVADAGGICKLSKVIVQDDPQPSIALFESASLVLSNVLQCNSGHYFEVPLIVLVKLLHSTLENAITVALNGLLVREKNDASGAVLMAEYGAIDALLKLLCSHLCEEASGRLLETLFNNKRVREMNVAKYAIVPLSHYLLDPQTRSQSAKFLAALALGDLFQQDSLARTSDAVSACHALVSLLEDQSTDDMKMVAICALQNLVMHSRTNRLAVAQDGTILVIQELLLSQNAEVAAQAALLIKYLFSNHTLQEYASTELIRSLTAALENELWSTVAINEEVLRTIFAIFSNFKKLRASEAATLCIPHLIGALKSGSEGAQEAVLDTLCLLQESWPVMNQDIAEAQALIAAEAIPVLQLLMKTCPPGFHDRADILLHCLPGCLTVTIKRGTNLKQTMGTTNAFCKLNIGNGPPRHTKVISHSTSPEWKEGFSWLFDVPPKGQKLYILCKSKNTFGKTTLGRVIIQIDKVVTEGIYTGFFSLSHDGHKDTSKRALEIEIVWSNRVCENV